MSVLISGTKEHINFQLKYNNYDCTVGKVIFLLFSKQGSSTFFVHKINYYSFAKPNEHVALTTAPSV